MGVWRFIVPGPPRGKGRPRVAPGHARPYTDAKTVAYERTVARAALVAMRGVVLEGPVGVDVLVVIERPKRLMRRRDPDGLIWAPRKPDSDNARKIILDGLKRHWGDDSQVCAGSTTKVYAERGREPRVEVTVYALSGDGP